MKSRLTVAAAVLAAITFASCAETPTGTLVGGDVSASGAEGAADARAPFPVFHQGFNHGVFPWIDEEGEGPAGWCGDIEHVDGRGGADPKPSAGRGYATVTFGACNEFWSEVLEDIGQDPLSAPASGPNFDLMSTAWPASGFVQELDVYLDPAAYEGGLAFIYTNSLCILADTGACDPPPPPASPFRYFAVFVVDAGPALLLLDSPAPDAVPFAAVDEAGWYTFRHVFGSDGGTLTVDFELRKDGRLLGVAPVRSTFISTEETSAFDVDDLGSGYIWFPLIAPGVSLPIDEQRLRRPG